MVVMVQKLHKKGFKRQMLPKNMATENVCNLYRGGKAVIPNSLLAALSTI